MRDFEEIPIPKAILFDVDDTLIRYEGFSDSEWYKLIEEEVLSEFKKISLEELLKMISGELPRTFPREKGISPINFWKKVDEVILEKRKELAREGRIRRYEDAEALFKIDLPKAAVSNASKEATEFSLREADLLKAFSLIVGKRYEDLNGCKPNPGQILYTCEKLGISPHESWFVGNSRADVLAAKRAGSFPIQVLRGEEIAREAEAILPNLWDLLDLLDVVLS